MTEALDAFLAPGMRPVAREGHWLHFRQQLHKVSDHTFYRYERACVPRDADGVLASGGLRTWDTPDYLRLESVTVR